MKYAWNEIVLNHEQFIGTKVLVSKLERSSDQVIKPINIDALAKWMGNIPKDDLENMENIAPMLQFLGYDLFANPPNCGIPDEEVINKSDNLRNHNIK
uniref:Protein-tyrosine sulfotransferase n=1 Tax=Strongyloides venezuelensis TaxID=75913 RepID=A0A0K0F0F9_STRVS